MVPHQKVTFLVGNFPFILPTVTKGFQKVTFPVGNFHVFANSNQGLGAAAEPPSRALLERNMQLLRAQTAVFAV